MENELNRAGLSLRVIEDCLNGRRTVWKNPFKRGRNGLEGLAQRIEINSPLALVILFLEVNDFQSMHVNNAWHSAQGAALLVQAIRSAPVEPGMPVPEILLVAPPPVQKARGTIAPKFEGAEGRAKGLNEAIKTIAKDTGCYFFYADSVTSTSQV